MRIPGTRFFPVLSFLSVLLLLPACRAEETPPPGASKVLRDLSYVTGGNSHQKLDLYVPLKATGPLLVYIHGGGWRAGTKSFVPVLPMLGLGYAIASVEYRFTQELPFPAQIEDCKAAIRWLRAHAADYGYDPKRIAAMGDSAGGHLTALLATTGNVRDFDKGENLGQSSAIQCGLDFYGPTDFPGYIPPSDIPAVQRTGPGSLLVQLLGGPVDEKLELAKRASPVTWVTKESAPLLILHGTKDPLVPVSQSKELAEKYQAVGVEATLDVLEGAGHGGKEFGSGDEPAHMLDFLRRHLSAAPAGKS